jgi:hypothetical protein
MGCRQQPLGGAPLVRKRKTQHRLPADTGGLEISSYIRGQTLPADYEPDRYAQWFFEFLRSELRSLTPGQQLGMRADLWRFVAAELYTKSWSADELLPPIDTLEQLQAIARDGIESVRRGDWFTLESGVGYGIAALRDRLIRGSRKGSFNDLFRAAVMDTLQANWHRVRACPRCGEIFLKLGKQKYCDAKCANRAHWATFKAKRPARNHHDEYVHRTQKRTGAKLKIKPRRTK